MKNLKQQLVDGDPVALEGGLDASDALTIRHRVLAEARMRPVPTQSWWTPLVVASALAACLLLAITIGTRLTVNNPPVEPFVKAAPARQMQFATPGGTRIMWTFHQELAL